MSQEVSSIGIRFGEEFQGDGHLNLKFNLVINSQQASEELKAAIQETGNKFESLNYSLLFTFKNCDNVNDLNALFNQIKNDEGQHDGNEDNKGVKLSNQLLYKKLRKLLKDLDIQTHIVGQNLYLQVTLKESIAEKVLEPFQILLESGLKDIAQKTNKLDGEICFDVSNEQISEILKTDRLLVPFLNKMRAKVNLSLDKNLSNSVEDVIKNIDDSLLTSPQVQFLKYFKNLDIDLAFNSADNLPEPIKQHILPYKLTKLDENKKQEEKAQIEAQTLLFGFINQLPSNISARIFIDEFAFLNVSVSAKGFQKVLTESLTEVIQLFM